MPLNPFPDPETYKIIIGAGMAVHSELGCGFLERVYRVALPIEFERMGVPFATEKNLKICYKGTALPVGYFADFICFERIVVEVKALSAIGGQEEGITSQSQLQRLAIPVALALLWRATRAQAPLAIRVIRVIRG